MSWFRKFDPIHTYRTIKREKDVYRGQKYLTLLRVAYFFGTSTLLLAVSHMKSKYDKQEEEKENKRKLEAGEPIVRDLSDAHATMRERGTEAGVLYKYSPDKGWHLEEYHRGEYLSKLQKQALDDAREAQKKALSEGRKLPPDAILLIDESGSS